MSRRYQRTKELLPKIMEMKERGMTHKEIEARRDQREDAQSMTFKARAKKRTRRKTDV